jgi:hypothetical protein
VISTSGDGLPGRQGSARPSSEALGRRRSPFWIWVVVAVPLLLALLDASLFLDAGYRSYLTDPDPAGAEILRWEIPKLLLRIPAGLVIVLSAVADSRALRAGGLTRPVPWAWALLSLVDVPLYAMLRALHVRRWSGRGLAPLVVGIVSMVLQGAILQAVLVAPVLSALHSMPR